MRPPSSPSRDYAAAVVKQRRRGRIVNTPDTVARCVAVGLVAVLGSASRLQLVHWESSVKLWERHAALTTDPIRRAEALINLGNGLAAEGRAEQSAVMFRRALALIPVTVIEGDKAHETEQEALRAHAHHSRAEALDQAGRADGARREWEAAVRLDKTLAEPLASLAYWHHEHANPHDLDQALGFYSRAVEVARRGATDAGLAERKRVRSRGDPRTVLNSGHFWLGYGMCVTRLQREIQQGKHMSRSSGSSSLANNVDAHSLFTQAVNLDPTLAEAHYRLAKLEREPDLALRRYTAALAADPEFVDAFFGKANLLNRLGRHRQAIAAYRQAIALEPAATDLRINLALALRADAQAEAALAEAHTVLRLDEFHSKANRLVELLTP